MAKKICNPCHDLTHVDLPNEFEHVSPSLSLFSSKLEEINAEPLCNLPIQSQSNLKNNCSNMSH